MVTTSKSVTYLTIKEKKNKRKLKRYAILTAKQREIGYYDQMQRKTQILIKVTIPLKQILLNDSLQKNVFFCHSNFACTPRVGLEHVPLLIAINRQNDRKYILTKPIPMVLIAVISGFNT